MANLVEQTVGLGHRRPLRSRDWLWAKRLASRLASEGWRPNSISMLGMFAAIGAGGLIAVHMHAGSSLLSGALLLIAAALVQARLICNLLDGMVAIEGGKGTPDGELYNELPDRVSDSGIFIGMGLSVGGDVALGLAAALAAVLTAYVRAVGKGAGAGSDFGGPLDKKMRMMIVTLTCVLMAVKSFAMPEFELDLVWKEMGWRVGPWGVVLGVIAIGSMWTCVLRVRRIARGLRARGAGNGSTGAHS